jgi:purine-nucleoside phosphorylase
MTSFPHLDASVLRAAEEAFRRRFPGAAPRVGLILGSGWGSAIRAFCELDACDASEIPGLGRPTVAGHNGRVILAECRGVQTLIFEGRRHWYEGDGWLPVVLPIFLLKSLDAWGVLLTNAAGGIRRDLKPGVLLLIQDHINLMGDHPLRGPHQPLWGTRFPDMSRIYSPAWNGLIAAAAKGLGLKLAEGVYAALSGPAYETPAEIRMLASLNADLVGMSTVPEAIVARAAGLEVAALSCVTNQAAGLTNTSLSHDEALAVLQTAGEHLGFLLDAVWKRLSQSDLLSGDRS